MGLPSLASLLLCLFAGVLLAARGGSRGAHGLIAGGFLAGLCVAWWIEPGNTAVSLMAGGAVAVALLGSPRVHALLLLSGLVSGLAVASVLPAQAGWAVLPVWLLALLAVIASNHLARSNAQFAPSALLDQGGCALLIAAPVIAALPAAQAGWKSALTLAGASASVGAPLPGWWLALPLVALICGALRQWWYR